MSQECIHIDDENTGRYYNIWYDSKENAAISIRRIKTGIDFRANKEARKQMSANTYLLFMSLITLPPNKEWLLNELCLEVNTALSEEDIVQGLQDLSELGYLVLTDKRRSAVTILEAPRLKSRL